MGHFQNHISHKRSNKSQQHLMICKPRVHEKYISNLIKFLNQIQVFASSKTCLQFRNFITFQITKYLRFCEVKNFWHILKYGGKNHHILKAETSNIFVRIKQQKLIYRLT